MNHEEIKAKLFEFYDGALIKEEEREISLHLSECSQCRTAIEQWNKLKEALFSPAKVPVPLHFTENVMAKIYLTHSALTIVSDHPSQEGNTTKSWRSWLDSLGIPKWERAFAGLVLGIGIGYSLIAFSAQKKEDFNALWADFSNGGRSSVLFSEEEPDLAALF